VVIATGKVTTLAGSPGEQGKSDGIGAAARFYYPVDVAGDGAGNLFVADTENHAIRKVVMATGEVTTLAGRATGDPFGSLTGIASDGAGSLFVTDWGTSTIHKVVIATGEVTTLAGSPGDVGSTDGIGAAARFYYPTGVASDRAGNLFVAEFGNNTIRKVVIATGEVTTFAGSAQSSGSSDGIGAAARFSGPHGIASDGEGNLFVADSDNHAIRRIAIGTRTVTTVVGSPDRMGVALGPLPAALTAPWGLAVGPAGELYVSDYQEGAILVAQF
jgi:streptogramin lyase